jgi:hypothetical protein
MNNYSNNWAICKVILATFEDCLSALLLASYVSIRGYYWADCGARDFFQNRQELGDFARFRFSHLRCGDQQQYPKLESLIRAGQHYSLRPQAGEIQLGNVAIN